MKRNVNPEFVSQDMQGGEREKKKRQGSGWIFLQGYKKSKSKDTNQRNYLSSYLNSYFNVKSRNNLPSRRTHVCIKTKIYRPTQLKKNQLKNNSEGREQLQKCLVWGHIVEGADCVLRSLMQFTRQKSCKHKTEQCESSSHH